MRPDPYSTAAVFLLVFMVITLISLAGNDGPLWAYPAVLCAWAVAGWGWRRAATAYRQGLVEPVAAAFERETSEGHEVAREQLKPQVALVGWSALLVTGTVVAFAVTYVAAY